MTKLQNIPIRSDLGKQIRRSFFEAAPGRVFLSLDFSQLEARITAHYADRVRDE